MLNHHRAGEGPPLVLIHGIGSRWQVWEPVLATLTAQREVVAIDLPGFGDSPMPPPGTPAGASALTRLVAEFLADHQLGRPHVAGNSLGGRVALELAKQGAVRSATCLSPAGFHTPLEGVYQHASLWGAAHGARLLAPRAERLLARPRLRAAALVQFVAHPDRLSVADAVASTRALANAPWFDETLRAVNRDPFSGQIEVPVTIAWAQHDHVLLPHQAKRAKRLIPHARTLVLRGCGHVPTYDDPAQVARVLLEGSDVE